LRRKLLVDKWRKKLNALIDPGDLLILNVDRNIWHKRWDAVFESQYDSVITNPKTDPVANNNILLEVDAGVIVTSKPVS